MSSINTGVLTHTQTQTQIPANNRSDTQKLYMTLLQFDMYDNPHKYYARKIKVKRVPITIQSAGSSSAFEYIISSVSASSSSASAA